MNLILAVVVDCAVEARSANEAQKVKEKAEIQLTLKKELLEVVRELDKNNDGHLDLNEVMHAAANNKKFQFKLHLVGLTPDELYEIMLAVGDGQGRITYHQFCNFIHDLHQADSAHMAYLNKMNFKHMRRLIFEKMESQERVLLNIERQLVKESGISPCHQDSTSSTVQDPKQSIQCIHDVPHSSTVRAVESTEDFCAIASDAIKAAGDLVSAMHDATQPSHGNAALSDLLQSFETQITVEISHLRKSQAEIDSSWARLLGIFRLALEQCSDVAVKNPIEVVSGKPDRPLGNFVAEQFVDTLQTSLSGRGKSLNDAMYDVGEDFASMLRKCRALTLSLPADRVVL